MRMDRKVILENWPFVVVGCIVRKGNKIILVQEAKVDRGLWNQPAGWLGKGENIIEGARRETKEETGLDIKINGLLGIFSLVKKSHPERKTDVHAIKAIFAAEALTDKIEFNPNELLDARWFTKEEIERMGKDELRDMDIKIAVERFFRGKIFPLDLIHHTEVDYKK